MNPATEDILAAVQSVPAKTVFVLPNNKNIIMAAEQAQKLADRQVGRPCPPWHRPHRASRALREL